MLFREQTLCTYHARFLEEIVVRISRIVVDTGLQLEHTDWEDWRLAMAEAFVNRIQRFVDDEATCR